MRTFNKGSVRSLLACLLWIAFGYVSARNSYLFVAPNVIRPGREFSIQGELLEEPNGPTSIIAVLRDGEVEVGKTEANVVSKSSVNFNILVPAGLKPSSKKLQLKITGSGGLTFDSTKSVDFEDKSVSVYIQTDKSVYKPGQTIHMRIFGTTPELTIVNDKLKVELHDPKGNKIKQWSVSGSEMGTMNNVFITQQILSEYPVLGEWKIKAKLLSHGADFTDKVVKVEEYVLPKFEVELDLPSFGRVTDATFEVNVKAKYTFGKPINGEASLSIRPKKEKFVQFRNGKRVNAIKEINMKFPVIAGNGNFSILMSDLKELDSTLSGRILVFKVNVTETLTKAKQSDEQEVSFYNNPTKVEFPKSLPDTFKPYMTYDIKVKVSLQDGSPPDRSAEKLTLTITQYTKKKVPQPCWGWGPQPRRDCGWRFREMQTRETTKKFDVPVDGIVSYSVKPKKSTTQINVKATYKGSDATLKLKKRHSPSNSYIQVTTSNSRPESGKPVRFIVKSTEIASTVQYQVLSKGMLTKAGSFQMPSKRKVWKLAMTPSMAPRSRIIVYYIRTDGEVVADTLTINVNGHFKNKVSVVFNDTEARPAEKIELKITADATSQVNVLAVDKSVLLLGTGNDISSDQVIGEMNKFNLKSKKKSSHGFCDWFCWRWPMPSGGEDVKDVFDEAGVIVLTDAKIYEHREEIPDIHPRFRWARRRFNSPVMAMANVRPLDMGGRVFGNPKMKNAKRRPAPNLTPNPQSTASELAPVQRVRKLFPETWLWRTANIPSNETEVVIEETVPDTITSWIATAFAIHPDSGLGLSQSPAQLTISTPFFMVVSLPYSVVRGEKVIVQVNLHNYSPDPLFTKVMLEKSSDFDNIGISGQTESRNNMDVHRTITVQPNEVVSVYFPIIPVTIGRIDLNIRAQTPVEADAVVKKLLVEPEGAPGEHSLPVLIDLDQVGTYTETVTVEYPSKTVIGSERLSVSVIGDIMGPTLKGLNKLLKMPYGCGEQNMLNFAPNIFVVKYLEATNNLNMKTKTTATDFMEKGYQRELTYRHDDGSFSAFGSKDSSGSTWLTAFVAKSFSMAKPYIFIDDEVVKKAVDWLIKQQNEDGTFNEPGRVIHKGMQGGSTAGKVSLTSYVLISLLEARVMEGVSASIQVPVEKSVAYLVSQVPQLDDTYDLAIVLYALQLANSTEAQTVLNKLNAKAIIQGGLKHWEKTSSPPSSKKGKAVDIELTAYGLLALANQEDRLEGVKVLKWLSKQRNSDGGFMSTQDTVVALQGLAEMASLIYRPFTNLDVKVEAEGVVENFQINNTNALVLQTRPLPFNKRNIQITATGQGFAIVQVRVNYNVMVDEAKDSFMLKVNLPVESQTLNEFEVEACASWLKAGSSSMAVIEVGSPSGFDVDPALVISEPRHKRFETEARKSIFYFDEISPRNTCVRVTMQRVGLIAGAMPVPVRVYDYYEPSKQVTEFYIPDVIKNSQVCDICGTDCDFCFNNPV